MGATEQRRGRPQEGQCLAQNYRWLKGGAGYEPSFAFSKLGPCLHPGFLGVCGGDTGKGCVGTTVYRCGYSLRARWTFGQVKGTPWVYPYPYPTQGRESQGHIYTKLTCMRFRIHPSLANWGNEACREAGAQGTR